MCKIRSLLLLPFAILAPTVFASPIELGKSVPDVSVLCDTGDQISLKEHLAEGYALVYFYPKSFTGGCTAQACSLRDGWTELRELGVTVLGVSSDKVEVQAAFREKHNLPFNILADTKHDVSKAFGAPNFSRQAFLFKDGVLVWRDLRAATRNQADDVLKAIAALQEQG